MASRVKSAGTLAVAAGESSRAVVCLLVAALAVAVAASPIARAEEAPPPPPTETQPPPDPAPKPDPPPKPKPVKKAPAPRRTTPPPPPAPVSPPPSPASSFRTFQPTVTSVVSQATRRAAARAKAKARAEAKARLAKARARAKVLAAARARALVVARARQRTDRSAIERGGLPARGETFVAPGVVTLSPGGGAPLADASPAAAAAREQSGAVPAVLAAVLGLALCLLIAAGLPEAALRPLGGSLAARRSYVAALGGVTLGAAVIGLAVTLYGV